ncbi:MAG: acetyltransferase [Candidatus Omnitrophica bacterium]|nr:acetyltransferase [Candidatus Omnitrophota bacterium]MDD5310555.1 acetyltransferase [Candidatus Omnitrophota bacterium]MDD5546019.1 acetyltransferase [Candidatus Omnitrophota bacterium]
MKKKILLIGAGGHCKVVLDLLLSAKEYEVAGIIDVKQRIGEKVFGVPVSGSDTDLPRFSGKGVKHCFISAGSVGDTRLRVKLYNLARRSGFVFPNLVSPYALVSSRSVLGQGNFIAPGVIVNAGSRIGDNCILNTGAIVEHDCKIGDFVHLSPGALLSGGVSIGSHSHIGTGSIVIQNVKIGEMTVVGAGSVVTGDIRKGVVAYGNPCKEMKQNA